MQIRTKFENRSVLFVPVNQSDRLGNSVLMLPQIYPVARRAQIRELRMNEARVGRWQAVATMEPLRAI